MDRRGFGASPDAPELGWPVDTGDASALLDEIGPSHLVGHSYGGVVALLAAGLRPKAVRSLLVIEPPALGLVEGDRRFAGLVQAYDEAYASGPTLDAQTFVRRWVTAGGRDVAGAETWMTGFGDLDWAAADASRRERSPMHPPFDFEVLAALDVPKVVVTGGWLDPDGTRLLRGDAFRATARAVAAAIGADVVEFEASAHNPQIKEPERFNDLLRRVWRHAEEGSGALT